MTETASEQLVKQFYTQHHDRITNKRHNSPYWLRAYSHAYIHAQFLPYLNPRQSILDAGCGEGNLSCLVAQEDISVVGVDISAANVRAACALAEAKGGQVQFQQADCEKLPFPDNSFDVVMSSHVLEHLPNLEQGLAEIYRVTRSLALIAMPTCLNPACWALLGGDNYWRLRRRSLIAVPIGLTRTLMALIQGAEGPDEGYGGNQDVPHVWRFPHVMRAHIERAGFHIEHFEAGPLIFPYFAQYIKPLRRLQPKIDQLCAKPFIRNLGYGSLAVCRK